MNINQTEMAGMLVNAYILLRCAVRPVQHQSVLLRGDNTSAVTWIVRHGTGNRGIAGVLIRALAMVEIATEMSFDALHVAGSDNGIADFLSRNDHDAAA